MTDRLNQLLKLHAADPDDADVPYMIAMEHAGANDPASALDWLGKTLTLDPHYHYAYYQQAKALAATDNLVAAQAAIQTGIETATADGNTKAVNELNELLAAISS